MTKKKFIFAIGDSERELRVLWIVLDNQRDSRIAFKGIHRGDTSRLWDMKENFVGDVSPDWISDVPALINNYDAKIICLLNLDEAQKIKYWLTCEELQEQFPDNVRIFDPAKVLVEHADQHEMLKWVGFDKPILYLDLNDDLQYKGENDIILEDLPFNNVMLCAWCDNHAKHELLAMGRRIAAYVCSECALKRDLGYFSKWKRQEDIYAPQKETKSR